MKNLGAALRLMIVLLISISPLQAEILIGFAGPMTGPRAWSGQQFQRGAEQAVSDINTLGGVLGQRLTLVVGDDASDVRQAQAVANKLIADGVSLVIGHRSSDMTNATAPIYAAAGVIQITPSSTNPALTEKGIKTFFRVCGRDDQQAILAADHIHQHWSGKNIGIVHDNSSYGLGLAESTRDLLNALGTRETLFLGIDPGQLDYGDLLAEVKRKGIEVLYTGAYSAESALIVRQARDAGLDFQLISGDALHNSDFGLIAGDAANGAHFTFDIDPRTRTAAKSIVQRFRAVGYEPEGYTIHTYAALQVWAQAVDKAGSLNPDAVVKVMHKQSFDTVLGNLSFDEKGDLRQHDYAWYLWRDGAPVRQ
ncbi:branched-chain amino acid ABC transporter substrate-binding protein [Gammaproteobacteria bacterium]|nr:branched-chain amino acid ABC transporter substrate-binding protein [Gammaproteobacteria bacterium]